MQVLYSSARARTSAWRPLSSEQSHRQDRGHCDPSSIRPSVLSAPSPPARCPPSPSPSPSSDSLHDAPAPLSPSRRPSPPAQLSVRACLHDPHFGRLPSSRLRYYSTFTRASLRHSLVYDQEISPWITMFTTQNLQLHPYEKWINSSIPSLNFLYFSQNAQDLNHIRVMTFFLHHGHWRLHIKKSTKADEL